MQGFVPLAPFRRLKHDVIKRFWILVLFPEAQKREETIMLSACGVYRKPNSAQEAQQKEGSTLALALALRHATQAQAQGLTPHFVVLLVRS